MKSWEYEAAYGAARAWRLRRYADREGLRSEWYSLGFWDGWVAAIERERKEGKGDEWSTAEAADKSKGGNG